MHTYQRVVAAVLALAMTLPMFGQGTKEQVRQTERQAITVVDHDGDSVTLPRSIDRVVVVNPWPLAALAPIFLGSSEKIVGMPPAVLGAAKAGLLGEIFPDMLTVRTGFSPSDNVVNVEELLSLRPDVVFTLAGDKKTKQSIVDAGIPCVSFSVSAWDYNVLDTYDAWIKLLGEVFPDEGKGDRISAYSHQVADMIQERVKDIPDAERKKVLFLFQYGEKTIVTSGKHFFGQYWCDAVGAKNVAEEVGAERNNAVVNMEQIYQWDPDVILITNFTPTVPEDLYNNTVGSYDWSDVKAVKNKEVYKMPLGTYRSYTPGADMPVTLQWIAKNVYPDLFSDIDLESVAKQYFQEMFGLALTDKQVHDMFNQDARGAEGVHLN